MRISLLALSVAASLGMAGLAAAVPAKASDPAEGVWLTSAGDAEIRLGPCDDNIDHLCGTIVWLKDALDENGRPVRDVKNPDPRLRDRPLLGLRLIRDLVRAGPGRWIGGAIYNPDSGKTYRSRLHLAANGVLKVEGCVLMICAGDKWRRAG